MKDKIKVVLKKPNEKAIVTVIDNEYEEFANYCDGIIDITKHPTIDGVDVVLNDVSLMKGMSPNIIVPECEEIFAGPLIFVGYDPDTEKSLSLTDEQVDKVLNYINRNQVFNMSVERAYLYLKLMGPFQQCEGELERKGIEECQIG